MWEQVLHRLQAVPAETRGSEPPGPIYGDPTLVRQRLGQGAFRILVTDVYERRCAITRERALPTLQAAHVVPVSKGGHHRVDNGLLMRSDVHTLFDGGYLTVTPDLTFRVSSKLKDDFDDGETYREFDRKRIWVPGNTDERPNREFLEWHNDMVFLK
jgi:putative restriction endonuclease